MVACSYIIANGRQFVLGDGGSTQIEDILRGFAAFVCLVPVQHCLPVPPQKDLPYTLSCLGILKDGNFEGHAIHIHLVYIYTESTKQLRPVYRGCNVLVE